MKPQLVDIHTWAVLTPAQQKTIAEQFADCDGYFRLASYPLGEFVVLGGRHGNSILNVVLPTGELMY